MVKTLCFGKHIIYHREHLAMDLLTIIIYTQCLIVLCIEELTCALTQICAWIVNISLLLKVLHWTFSLYWNFSRLWHSSCSKTLINIFSVYLYFVSVCSRNAATQPILLISGLCQCFVNCSTKLSRKYFTF